MSGRIDEILEFGNKLPSFPAAVSEAIRLLADDNTSNDRIVAVLQRDQGLVAQILKLSNSAFYGVSRRVSTVKQALLVLGRNAVRSLVVSVAAQEYLGRPQPGYLLERGALWQHSMAAGIAAALIAQRVQYRPADEAFVAGLLHDIGKVVLSEYLARHSEDIVARLGDPAAVSFDVIERELVGVDHATLGAMLADHWQLPPRLGQAIRFHHCPGEAGDDWMLPALVHGANALTLAVGVGLGVDGLQTTLDEQALLRLGLVEGDLELLADELLQKLAEEEAGA
jgi:putative nucleotidyltransferase with HDIG domain